MTEFLFHFRQVCYKFNKDEITVYAAQASFFTILAAFPFLMLLMALIQFIPAITKASLLKVLITMVPMEMNSLIVTVIEELYTKSPVAVLSVTAAAAVWSSSKGMLSIERGLNRVFGREKKRSYLMTRLVCACYTVVFMGLSILTLVLLVLGNSIQSFLALHYPGVARITRYVLTFRTMLFFLLTFSFSILYTYVPEKKLKFRSQLPGALFSTLGWMAFSFVFSLYFSNFSRYSVMYGSLTAIVLLMLWLYECICILFLGAEINSMFRGEKP